MVHSDSQPMQQLWILSSAGCSLGLAMGTWKPGPKSQNTCLKKKKEILTSERIVYKRLAPSVKLPKTFHEKRPSLLNEFRVHETFFKIYCLYSLFLSFSYSPTFYVDFFFPHCNLPKIKNKQKGTTSGSYGATVPLWHQSPLNSQSQEDSQHLHRTHATADEPRSPYHCSFQTQMPAWVTLSPAQGEIPVRSSREVKQEGLVALKSSFVPLVTQLALIFAFVLMCLLCINLI